MESQFHYGSIRIKGSTESKEIISKVSIPLWFDSNNKKKNVMECQFIVSIPLWFDSNKQIEQKIEALKLGLNSTMVRFE